MFDTIALGRRCSDKEYEEASTQLRIRLFEAQRQCIEKGIPLLITVAGVDGSGRGGVMNLLSEWMDSKFLRNHVFWMETDEERERPWEWRYWRCLPAAGQTAVFLGGWYGPDIRMLCCGEEKEHVFDARMHRYSALEASLADSGMAIVKVWLHLDERTHDKRLKKRLENKVPHHYFTPYDKKASENYQGQIKSDSRANTRTDRVFAPWTIVDAADAHYRNLSVARAVIEAVHRAVQEQEARKARLAAEKKALDICRDCGHISTLEAIDLSASADQATYKKDLEELQAEIRDLSYKTYKNGISSTIIFEGWDAAGKGGAIRRLMSGVDARISSVFPISAPSDEELHHHYLWRFWRHIPRAGFITVYDRSWYGRVLVERVEKLTPREDWTRAYSEINHFEEQLIAGHNILLKFWLHISPDEQLRRFQEREQVPWKQHKITEEDWRNREKWSDYLIAADEMFLRTSTDYAPWHIIAANDKKYARLEVLRICRDAMAQALEKYSRKKD